MIDKTYNNKQLIDKIVYIAHYYAFNSIYVNLKKHLNSSGEVRE
jgi:hypothetical protein